MNAEELWETTMDPQNRVLKRVTVLDAMEADKVLTFLWVQMCLLEKHLSNPTRKSNN